MPNLSYTITVDIHNHAMLRQLAKDIADIRDEYIDKSAAAYIMLQRFVDILVDSSNRRAEENFSFDPTE